MSDDYADAINRLEEEIDRAVNRALESLSHKEVVAELRRIADQWEKEA